MKLMILAGGAKLSSAILLSESVVVQGGIYLSGRGLGGFQRGHSSRWSGSVKAEGDPPVDRIIAAEENPFVKPLSNVYRVIPCRFCKGSREVKCDVCNGQGSLARGGFHKRNPVSLIRIVGSKWTAMESTFGWRHFHVHSKRKGTGKDWFLEMVSTCDDTTRFWVNAKNLKDRERWSAGWLQKEELMGLQEKVGTTICKACKGRQTMPCRPCAQSEGSQHHCPPLDIINV